MPDKTGLFKSEKKISNNSKWLQHQPMVFANVDTVLGSHWKIEQHMRQCLLLEIYFAALSSHLKRE
jgi:hypothetical protein